jgi:rhodanese-related sulfurtransferase
MTAVITPDRFKQICERRDDVALVDVRTPAEFRTSHLAAARNVPLDRLDVAALRAAGLADAQPLYVVCQRGGRGKQACEKLAAAGLVDVVNVEGGTLACEHAGFDRVRGKQTVSLERQVRIVAGSLVFVGAVLAIAVHPYFAGLSAFVGAGLVFAGLTDTCGMGMLLARMPWNQAGAAPPAPPTSSPSDAPRETAANAPSCCTR